MLGLSVPGEILSSFVHTMWAGSKYGWSDLSYIRTGNLISDLSLDLVQFGSDFSRFGQHLFLETELRYKSGPNKGELKWYIEGKRLMWDLSRFIAYRYGLPYEGPQADCVWPVERIMR
jgi:hypothetical protein